MYLIGDLFLYLAIFIDEFDGAIGEPDCQGVAGASAEGHPVVVNCV